MIFLEAEPLSRKTTFSTQDCAQNIQKFHSHKVQYLVSLGQILSQVLCYPYSDPEQKRAEPIDLISILFIVC